MSTQGFNNYQSVAPKAIGTAAATILKTHSAKTNIMQFGTSATIGKNNGDSLYFRRYIDYPVRTEPLADGVNPDGEDPDFVDIPCQLEELGSWVKFSRKVYAYDPNKIPDKSQEKLDKQAHETLETYDYEILKAGSSVIYSDGVARTSVASTLEVSMLELAESIFDDGRAEKFSEIKAAGVAYGNVPLEGAYIVLFHSHLKADLRNLPGFTLATHYPDQSSKINKNEFGQWGPFKFLESILYTPEYGAGASATNTSLRATNGKYDVYPFIAFGKDAYGLIKLAGMDDIQVKNGAPVASTQDPMAREGFLSWLTDHDCAITNEDWLVRLEVACSKRRR